MIRSFLDASSGHLSPDTWSWLEGNLADYVISNPTNNTAASIAGGKTRYGWLIYAPEDAAKAFPRTWSPCNSEPASRELSTCCLIATRLQSPGSNPALQLPRVI